MKRFDIAWHRRCVQRRYRQDWLIEAILLERKLLDGKPHMSIVARLACIIEDRTGDLDAQEKFWHDAAARLGRLSRLSDRDLDEIESVLMKRVERPLLQAVRIGRVRPAHDPA